VHAAEGQPVAAAATKKVVPLTAHKRDDMLIMQNPSEEEAAMNVPNIRIMTPSDIVAAIQLWRDTPGMGLNVYDDSPEAIARFIERNPRTCLVADDGKELLGCVICGHDGRRATIYHLAVRQDARLCGVGKALVAACESAMSMEGITKLRLLVFKTNEGGNVFWESVGFHARGDVVYRDKHVNIVKDSKDNKENKDNKSSFLSGGECDIMESLNVESRDC
jgi:ribosomal protein S18 acetylase RimI-like enzyme